MLDVLPALVRHYGEPFGDSSALAVWMLAQETRKHVTVVLTGDGGDEGFGGYDWYRMALRLKRLSRVAPIMTPLGAAVRSQRPWAKRIKRALHVLALDEPERFAALRTYVRDDEVQTLYAGDLLRERQDNGNAVRACLAQLYRSGNGSALRRMRLVDVSTYIADCLMPKVDVATMAHGLEARSPLLDYRVLEFAAALPSSLKFRRLETKRLLKRLAARLVPSSAVYRRKQGFSMPLATWLRGPLRKPLEVLLGHARFAARGYFDPSVVRNCLDRHMAGEDHSTRLWALLCLELWFRMFVDGEINRQDSLHDLK